jgi:subtilisin-like proprotein convertase family protein
MRFSIIFIFLIFVCSLNFAQSTNFGAYFVGNPTKSFSFTAPNNPGGTFSVQSVDDGATGGIFVLTNTGPTTASFTFGGATSTGSATLNLLYQGSGIPSEVFSLKIKVLKIAFSKASPATIELGSGAFDVTMKISPAGGSVSITSSSPGTTGGSFSLVAPLAFRFSGYSNTGVASVTFLYTSTLGETAEFSYELGVLSISFNPTSPLLYLKLSDTASLQATGSPSGGTYSFGAFADFGTGGTFGAIHSSAGTFNFGGTSSAGKSHIDVHYTDSTGRFSLKKIFIVRVQELPLTTASPATLLLEAEGTLPLSVSVKNAFAGGSLTLLDQNSGGTAGTFSTSGNDTFSFTTATAFGTASANFRYTPLAPATPVLFTYVVYVIELSFTPVSPIIVGLRSTTNVEIQAAPSGGGILAVATEGEVQTGGAFSISGTNFLFIQPTSVGTASVTIQYQAPLPGAKPVQRTFSITVATLRFIPPSPLGFRIGTTQDVQAFPSPAGGTFSSVFTDVDSTGITVTPINATGIFNVSGGVQGGRGEVEVQYTPPNTTAFLSFIYIIHVVGLTFDPPSPAQTVTGNTLNITAIGTPPGGQYFGGGNFNSNTQGTFSVIASDGTFTFGGATQAGIASTYISYLPPLGNNLMITLLYIVTVVDLGFLPPTPHTVEALSTGSVSVDIQAIGTPTGGTYSLGSGGITTGGTGGSFIGPNTSGLFSFAGATVSGIATIDIQYNPPVGPPFSRTYVVNVIDLNFSTGTDISSVLGGDPDLDVTAISTEGLGIPSIRFGAIGGDVTGGTFTFGAGGSASEPFTFTTSSAALAGTTTLEVIVTASTGFTFTRFYTVEVSVLSTLLQFCNYDDYEIPTEPPIQGGLLPLLTGEPTIVVDEGPASILSLQVFIDLDYDSPEQLTITLRPPSGTDIVLVTAGNITPTTSQVYAGVMFDDRVTNPISSITTNNAAFIPEEALSFLNGTSPLGIWSLSVTVAGLPGSGRLKSWGLIFNSDPVGTVGSTMPLIATSTPELDIPVTFISQGEGSIGFSTDTINVPEDETIIDLDVLVDITHEFTDALQIELRSPQNTVILLKDFNFQGGDDDDDDDDDGSTISTIYDDEIFSGSPDPFSHRFSAEPLFLVDNTSTLGLWTLEITDYAVGELGEEILGVLHQWELRFTIFQPGDFDCSPDNGGFRKTPSPLVYLLDDPPSPPLNFTLSTLVPDGAFGIITSNTTQTGGSFMLLDPVTGSFSFDGATTEGSATVEVEYITAISKITETLTTFVPFPFSLSSAPNLNLFIGGFSTTDSTLETFTDTTVSELRVRIDITHDFIGDLIIDLIAPDFTSVRLSDGGGLGGSDMQVIFDDDALDSIQNDFSGGGGFGPFSPQEPLSTFTGVGTLGMWTLTITDTFPGSDDGILNEWALAFNFHDTLFADF